MMPAATLRPHRVERPVHRLDLGIIGIGYILKREEKPVRWVGSAKSDLRALPKMARRTAGFEVHRVQDGLEPRDAKPISTIGPGTNEIRIRVSAGGSTQYRIFFVAKFEEAVWVLHVFQKATRKTSHRDIEIGRQRYARMLRERPSS